MQSLKVKPSVRGLYFLTLFFLVCLLPLALFRVGYKFNFTSRELVLLVFLNLLVVFFTVKKGGQLKINLTQILLLSITIPIFLFNYSHLHSLAVLVLYLVLLLLILDGIPGAYIFIWLAWSAMIATIFSFYQYWSTAYGVVPFWLKLARPTSRMAGVLGQPNLLACLIIIGIFSWYQILWQRFGEAKWPWFYQLPVTAFFWALLLTGSRSGMLAFVSALLLLSWGLSRAGAHRFLAFFAIQLSWSLSLGLMLYLLIQPPGIEIITNRTLDFYEQSTSTGARLVFGGSALAMGLDHLWSGVGLGGYRRLLGSYMLPVSEWLHIPYDSISATLWAHNDFLQVFAECGLFSFLLLLFVFVNILLKILPTKNPRALFCFCAIWSFFVFMQFGHPFNDHVLVFFLTFLVAGALNLSPDKFSLKVSKKLTFIFLVPCVLFIDFCILAHAFDMYHLKGYLESVNASMPLTVEQLTSLRAEYHYPELIRDGLIGWEFQYVHLQALGIYAIQHTNSDFAAYLIPDFEKFQSENDSSALTYLLARLYFLVGRYDICKKTADMAFLLKPDMYHYSNFGHICLVFDVSRREKKPVNQLLGEKYFSELRENNVFSMNMLDDNLCAL